MRVAVNLLSLVLLASGLAAQAPDAGTIQARVLGSIFGRPAALAPASGLRQEVALAALPGGAAAVLIYRYAPGAKRLPRSFFDSRRLQTLAVAPAAGCPAILRALVFQSSRDAQGKESTQLALGLLPGAQQFLIAANLDRTPACYLLVAGGGQ